MTTASRKWPNLGWLRLTRGGIPGPWHILAQPMGSGVQAFCGSKVTGFARTWRPPDDPPPDGARRCVTCATAYAADRPKAWRR